MLCYEQDRFMWGLQTNAEKKSSSSMLLYNN